MVVLLVYLLFGNAHVVLDIGEDSRLDVVAFGEGGFPSTLQFSSLADATLNELQHTPLLFNADLKKKGNQKVTQSDGCACRNMVGN